MEIKIVYMIKLEESRNKNYEMALLNIKYVKLWNITFRYNNIK